MSVKHSFLALLSEAPRSAAQARKAFELKLGGLYSLNMGQVTQTLARLERDGLVTISGKTISSNGRHADLYEITPAGLRELDSWWSEAFSTAATDRDELVIKFALAAQHDGRDGIDFIEILDAQRYAALRALRSLNRQADETASNRNSHRLAIEKRIFELEAQLRWLDRIESLPAPQAPPNFFSQED